ncbi:MAG: type III pantothenate kinase [Nitrospirae bacterium]|nr:type III pantothenate kinase [Nitrospirota bacterium]
MNIIAVDIGNSSIKIGLFRGLDLSVRKIETHPKKAISEYEAVINGLIKEKNIYNALLGVIISSVVPAHTEAFFKACKTLITREPLILTHKIMTGIAFDIKEPERLGTDRIAASVGACELFEAPVAVVDFGTATTVNFIGENNVYKGGAIVPGVRLMKDALSGETAQLPDIDISIPIAPLGKDTTENILSGIIYGTAGAVERIIVDTERAETTIFKVVVTGGYSELFIPLLRRVDHIEPYLVLKGLKFIYERNA